MAYHLMAGLYDVFMKEAPYDKWVEFTENVIKQFNLKSPSILDLGCGTGEITVRLANNYNVTGVDYSSDMLTIAEQKAFNHSQTINFIHQDLRELEGLSDYDLAISFCDVINYITTVTDVQLVFQNIADTLKEGGLFIFDVHSMRHVQEELINQSFSDVTDEHAYIWNCFSGDAEGEMYHDITFFSSNGDNYTRFDETHHQRTFPISTYEDLLKKCNLEILKICADFSLENNYLDDFSERIFIIAEKRTRT